MLYGIPVDTRMLAEGDTGGGIEGENSWGTAGYRGPMPPPGRAHRYFFRLYALDAALSLAPGATKEELLDAMRGHVVAQAELMGTYQRR